ncbi:kinase [Microbacterium sp. ANT_H45B]|uniref:AAA family ATPase n=1 Tax=Microbacterium sp. ANT_H45B TaxID=2597346 RepID=UPI0011ED0710|nr:AAA family ATPase [Microbacterium sp. ANT_H45B]KAA0960712.1 kinase [Microbacterium sp. ANT_H45B]
MAAIGSASTRLIVLRGDSGSGKTTTAAALRPHLGHKTAVIHQDYFRRELLASGEKKARSADAAVLVDAAARQSLDLGYDVILDGIFNLRDYADRLERLWRDHRGVTRIYQFDVGFDETVRRHAARELRHTFTADKMREWYDGWQPLEFVEEGRIGPDETLAQITERIVTDISAGQPKARS